MSLEDLKRAVRVEFARENKEKCAIEECGELSNRSRGRKGSYCPIHAKRQARVGNPRGGFCSRCNCPNIPSFPSSRLCDYCYERAPDSLSWAVYKRRHGMGQIGPHSKQIPRHQIARALEAYREAATAHNREKFPKLRWGCPKGKRVERLG